MGRIAFDFTWIPIAIAILLAVISYFFSDLGSTSSMITTVVAAMTTGQLYGQRTGAEVTSGFAWKAAAVMTLVSILIAVVVISGLQLAGVPLFPGDIPQDVIAIAIAIGALIAFLVCRFAFRWA